MKTSAVAAAACAVVLRIYRYWPVTASVDEAAVFTTLAAVVAPVKAVGDKTAVPPAAGKVRTWWF